MPSDDDRQEPTATRLRNCWLLSAKHVLNEGRKRVNDILACLGKMLRYAHEIELIDVVPRVKLLNVPQQRQIGLLANPLTGRLVLKATCGFALLVASGR